MIKIGSSIEPSHEIMALLVLRKPIQTRMRSHPVGLDVWFLVGPFVYFHTSCVRTAKALARLPGCAGSPEPSLVAYVISTIISWACSIIAHEQRIMSYYYSWTDYSKKSFNFISYSMKTYSAKGTLKPFSTGPMYLAFICTVCSPASNEGVWISGSFNF